MRKSSLRRSTLASLAVVAVVAGSLPHALAQTAPGEKPKHPSALFVEHCAGCHGADGKAATPDGQKLHAEVFADKAWQKKKTPKKEKLINSVLNGHGKKMPAFKDKVTPEQARSLVEQDVLGEWPE